MEVLVNNQTINTPASCTINKLLPLLGISDTRGIAVAVNEQVIAKASWPTYELLPEDKVMLIKATQGG
ncbi:thiamine biosynthesis sulfur transfer protein [Flammeovirgaceae bacterium 311]|nr:thiamine biosynthesis sulfur transfer protein [Flammeovirgaceae bacterium 311]